MSSAYNSAFKEEKKEFYQNMDHPLTDYYIFSDFTDYSLKFNKYETKINHY